MSFKHTVVMPKMSMTMETGELIGFHVAEGQEVKAGDVLFEVMTDKIDMEVEAPADGKIEKLLAAPSQVLEVGKPVLIMETQTQVLAFDFDEPTAEVQSVNSQPTTSIIETSDLVIKNAPETNTSARLKSVPAARKLASEKGVDLQSIHPTGPYETITYEDIANANLDPAILKRKEANKELIAKGVAAALQIPQTSFVRAVKGNFGTSAEWQAQVLTNWAKTLRSYGQNDIGVALIIESKYGSALPVFKNPDQLDLAALTELVRATTEQAKNGKVPLAMLNGATTTIFDLTKYQMASPRPVLFPNQETGLTIGVDVSGALSISLTIDLRALDFYDGAALLDRLVMNL